MGSADDPSSWLDQHGDYLYRMAYLRVRDRSAAEDIVQETLLAALRAWPHFQGASSVRTWLTGILKNKVVDHVRRTFQTETSEPVDESTERGTYGFTTEGRWVGHWDQRSGPVDWGDPHTLMENRRFWEALDRCLAKLPKRLAAVFALREIEQMDTAELCKTLEITPTNLWVMLHRARRQVRHCLEIHWLGHRRSDRGGTFR
ncbi:MAG TPA: sigma-70 family RNA polymerase sigma factor [candidate division Zixibacteria bacterium]|jgi:RNA polymerase sigma-70 factor (ECF subfamily)